MEWPAAEIGSLSHQSICLVGLAPRSLEALGYEGVDGRVDGLRTRNVGIHHRARCDCARANLRTWGREQTGMLPL